MAPSSPTQRKSSSPKKNNNNNKDNDNNDEKRSMFRATLAIADTASWYCSIIIAALILFTTFRDTLPYEYADDQYYYRDGHDSNMLATPAATLDAPIKGGNFLDHRHGPCDEIYVVGEGETLHTISDKCGDPYIVERNPHIHDPDDVFPGLVIKIVPSLSLHNRKLLR